MKDRTYNPKAARPDDSPFASLARALEARLPAEAPDKFAGIARAPDGAVDVYVTVSDQQLVALVDEIHASTGRRNPIRVVAGMKNSLASLERVFARVRGRARELQDQGVPLVQFGVHISANRVGIGVEGLTPAIAEALKREFGSDQIEVFEGGRWRAP